MPTLISLNSLPISRPASVAEQVARQPGFFRAEPPTAGWSPLPPRTRTALAPMQQSSKAGGGSGPARGGGDQSLAGARAPRAEIRRGGPCTRMWGKRGRAAGRVIEGASQGHPNKPRPAEGGPKLPFGWGRIRLSPLRYLRLFSPDFSPVNPPLLPTRCWPTRWRRRPCWRGRSRPT